MASSGSAILCCIAIACVVWRCTVSMGHEPERERERPLSFARRVRRTPESISIPVKKKKPSPAHGTEADDLGAHDEPESHHSMASVDLTSDD